MQTKNETIRMKEEKPRQLALKEKSSKSFSVQAE